MTWQLWTTCSSSSISSTDLSATSPRKLYWRSYWCDHCDNNMRSWRHCWITLTPRISAPLHHIFPAKAENLTANLATIHRDTCQHRSQTLKVSLVFVLQNCQFNPHQLLQSPADRSGSFDTDLFLWPDHTVYYMFEVHLHCTFVILCWVQNCYKIDEANIYVYSRTQWVRRTKTQLRRWWRRLRTILAYVSGWWS